MTKHSMRHVFGSRQNQARPVRWFRPRLICLEDRTVPSTITWTNRGQASDRFDSTFGANANLARGVIDATLTSWTRVLTSFNQPGGGNNINVTISMSSSGTGFGAGTNVSLSNGFPVAGSINIARGDDTNGDGIGDGGGWFLDPTPLDNSEFAGNILHAFTADVQAGSPAVNKVDLFTPVVHEVGHLVGMIGGSSRLQNPIHGTVTATGIPDNSPDGGGIGTYRVFDGPSVTHLFTSNNGGPGGGDSGFLLHSASPPGNQPVSFNSAFRGNRQLVGTQDIMNPVFEFNRRYLIADFLALTLKDAYNYTMTMPQSFGTFYTLLNQTTGNLLVRGGAGTSADNIVVSRSGSNLVVSVDLGNDPAGVGPNGDNSPVGAFVSSFPLASVTSIAVQPGGGADTLTVDFSGGNPLPAAGLSYAAGGTTGDNLVVASGPFTTATFNATTNNFGNVNIDGAVITYNSVTAVSAGSLSGPGGTLTKAGAGTLTLTGTNTYTGATTVNGGTLLVNGTLDAASAVTVNTGTLGGTGAANGPVTVNAGGSIAPGTSPGLFTAGGINLVGGTFAAELNGPTAGTDYDQLAVNGTATLGGSLNLTVGFTVPLGTQFRLIDNDDTDPVVGTFTGLAQGVIVSVGGQDFIVSYTGGTGNDVVLTRGTVAAAPRVADVDVNAGQADLSQRSRVTSIAVTFDAVVTFAGAVADAFTLSRVGGGAVGGFTATSEVVSGVTVVTLSGFTGAETRFGSLADGFFTLTVLSNQVSAGGQPLDGDGDGTPGGDFVQTGTLANGLFSLYGDVNGDGVVNAFDFSQFRNAFGTSTGDPAYRDYLDFDGSGTVNAFDFGQFRTRFGSSVP